MSRFDFHLRKPENNIHSRIKYAKRASRDLSEWCDAEVFLTFVVKINVY